MYASIILPRKLTHECILRSRENASTTLYSFRVLLFSTRAAPKVARPENHYHALGLTSKATQIEIKTAYYKLSKMYHPDMNKENNEEKSAKFRQVTAAYEVLGNLKLRKLYDKGFLSGPGVHIHSTDSDETDKDGLYKGRFYQTSKTTRSQPVMGRTNKFDFDAWLVAYY